jgi:transcriptional regulator with XRE-family HTH domain
MEPSPSEPTPLGQYLRNARDRIGLTQQQLADQATLQLGERVTKNMVTKVEGGNRELSFREAVALCDVLGLDISEASDALYRHGSRGLVAEAVAILDRMQSDLDAAVDVRPVQRLARIEQILGEFPQDDMHRRVFDRLIGPHMMSLYSATKAIYEAGQPIQNVYDEIHSRSITDAIADPFTYLADELNSERSDGSA